MPLATAYGLRLMRAYYAKAVTLAKGADKDYNDSLFNHYDRLTQEAERQAGISGGTMTLSYIKLNLGGGDAADS